MSHEYVEPSLCLYDSKLSGWQTYNNYLCLIQVIPPVLINFSAIGKDKFYTDWHPKMCENNFIQKENPNIKIEQ